MTNQSKAVLDFDFKDRNFHFYFFYSLHQGNESIISTYLVYTYFTFQAFFESQNCSGTVRLVQSCSHLISFFVRWQEDRYCNQNRYKVTKIEACLIIGLILCVHLLGIWMMGSLKKHCESKMFFIFHTSCTLYIQEVINGKVSSWCKAHINLKKKEAY